MLHLTQHYLAKTKRNKLNSKFNPWYKTMLKKRKIGKEAAMAKSRSVYSFIHRHWGAIRSSRCWNAPHARLVFLYSLSNKKNHKKNKTLFSVHKLCGQRLEICSLGGNLNALTSPLPVFGMTPADFAYGEVGGNLAVGLLRIRVFSRYIEQPCFRGDLHCLHGLLF